MKTEAQLVYGVINELRANNYNNDEVLNERYVRAAMNAFRGDELRIFYRNGVNVSDEVFQSKKLEFISTIKGQRPTSGVEPYGKTEPKGSLNYNTDFVDYKIEFGQPLNEYHAVLPKLIRLNDFGFYLNLYGIPVPIVPQYEYNAVKTDRFQKHLLIGTSDYKFVKLRLPSENDCLSKGQNKELLNFIRTRVFGEGIHKKFNLTMTGVFANPSDADYYDWENDPYPFPQERLKDFIQNFLRIKFGLNQSSKSDEVQNNRNDNVRYHDNTAVNSSS